MAIIYTYPVKTTPADADLILISDSESNNPKDKTKQITVESIKGLTAGVTKIIAGTNVTISPTSGVGDVTVNASGGGGGDTYTLQAEAKAGSSVPLKLDAATGTDSTVNLTEGTNVTITRNSATEVTIQSEDTTYAAMTNAALGLGKLRYTRGSTPAAESQTETASRTYGITDNASNQLVVNVPWTDTNTTDINLTTTGTSGAATWTSGTNTLNIPQYASSTPAAGSSGQIQYNNGSNGFTASAGLTYSTGSSLNTLVVGAQGSVPGVLEVKGADTTVGRLRLYCPDSGTPHYFELMGPDHSGAATYSVQVPEASPGGTEKILSVSTWDSGTSKADLAWVNLPSYSAATSSTLGLVKLRSDVTQTVAANAPSAEAFRTYGIQNNASGQMVVNVPWVSGTSSGGESGGFPSTIPAASTASFTAAYNNFHKVETSASNQNIVVTLPATATGDKTKIIGIKWIAEQGGGVSNTVTIKTPGAGVTIDGDTNSHTTGLALGAVNNYYELITDGADWWIK